MSIHIKIHRIIFYLADVSPDLPSPFFVFFSGFSHQGSRLATADFLSPFGPIFCILLHHFSHYHVLSHISSILSNRASCVLDNSGCVISFTRPSIYSCPCVSSLLLLLPSILTCSAFLLFHSIQIPFFLLYGQSMTA